MYINFYYTVYILYNLLSVCYIPSLLYLLLFFLLFLFVLRCALVWSTTTPATFPVINISTVE